MRYGAIRPVQTDVTHRRLLRARDFMYERHADHIDLDAVAREARLSRFHLLRTFRARFGETPHAYLTRVRLERAKELLASTDMPVTQVCFDVGFESLGSFSTLFARAEGAPPSSYRRRLRVLAQVPAALRSPFIPFCFVERFSGF